MNTEHRTVWKLDSGWEMATLIGQNLCLHYTPLKLEEVADAMRVLAACEQALRQAPTPPPPSAAPQEPDL
jgi:hypothetical protein